MPASQAVYQPLNGKEIRALLIKRITERINNIPMMKEGHAYHEATLAYSFTMTAVPADCPVPSAEFEEVVASPGYKLEPEYIKALDTAETLKNKKEFLEAQVAKLQETIDEVDKLLNAALVVEEVEDIISAGKIPDEVRRDNGLPLPRTVIITTPSGGTKKVDKMIDYSDL
jgi:hypothetical protein